jgi:hypothetical protein
MYNTVAESMVGISSAQQPSLPQKFSEQGRARLFTIAHLPKKSLSLTRQSVQTDELARET